MRGKSTVRIILAAFAVGLFLSVNAWTQSDSKKTQAACAKTPDAEIVAAIKSLFEADAEIKDQISKAGSTVKQRRA